MAVDPASEDLHCIVQVHPLQIVKPDDPLQFGEGGVTRLGGAQVVPGRKGVTGVDADADAGLVLHAVDQVAEVFKRNPRLDPLPGGIFDHGRHAVRGVEGAVDRFGDAVEALLLGDLLQMAPGVKVQSVEPEEFAPLHLVDEGFARLLQGFGVGMPEVDQIGVVRQDLSGRVPALVAGAAGTRRSRRRSRVWPSIAAGFW